MADNTPSPLENRTYSAFSSADRTYASRPAVLFGIVAAGAASLFSGCGKPSPKLSYYASDSKFVEASDGHKLWLKGHGTKFRLVDCAGAASGKDKHIEYQINGETIDTWELVEIDATEWTGTYGSMHKKTNTRVNARTPGSKELETRLDDAKDRLKEFVDGRDEAQVAPLDQVDE